MKPLKVGVVALCMERRQLLARFGAVLGAASLGGCLSQYQEIAGEAGNGDETEEDETTTENGTDDSEETTTEGTAVGKDLPADPTFTVTDSGCGQLTNEASVAFDAADTTVTVTGTIGGSNACYTAELAAASYDSEAGALDLTVASKREEGPDACADCIVAIDYEATFDFEDSLPATVTVTHDGMGGSEVVTTAESE
jgi:hypothetical protein